VKLFKKIFNTICFGFSCMGEVFQCMTLALESAINSITLRPISINQIDDKKTKTTKKIKKSNSLRTSTTQKEHSKPTTKEFTIADWNAVCSNWRVLGEDWKILGNDIRQAINIYVNNNK
jgi:hypothetical protein